MSRMGTLILVWLFYVALLDNWQIGNLALGLVIALGISAMVPTNPSRFQWRRLPAAIWALARYLGIILYDMVVSSIQVARILLGPELKIQPGIIAIPSGCQSELGTALSAHAISLTPGEVVVEMDDEGVMYTHCLDISRAEVHVNQAQAIRRDLLSKIFP